MFLNVKDKPIFNPLHIDEKARYLMNVNVSSHVCVSAIISIFTDDEWVEMDCNHNFKTMYFICERPKWYRDSQETLILQRQQVSCQFDFYYNRKACFKLTYDRQGTVSSSANYSYTQEMFAWSRGSIARQSCLTQQTNDGKCFCTVLVGYIKFRYTKWSLPTQCDCTKYGCRIIKRGPLPYASHCRQLIDFKCADNTCILSKYRCDKKIHCLDGSDEVDCRVTADEATQKTTGNDIVYRILQMSDIVMCEEKLIPLYLLCDGLIDCEDGCDELSCHHSNIKMEFTDMPVNTTTASGLECPPNWSRCTTHHNDI